MNHQLFNDALAFAAKAHDGQYRKGTKIPAITHPVAVAMMLQDMGCEDHIVVAALFHDLVEDTPVTLADIDQRFGRRVAELVKSVSEPDHHAPWEIRKTHTIEHLRTASLETKLVTCADKLHNLRSLACEYHRVGDDVWVRFKRGKRHQSWLYRNLAESLLANMVQSEKYPIFAEFEREVDNLFGAVVLKPDRHIQANQ